VQFHYGRNGELLGMLSVNSDGTNYLRVEYMWLNDTPIVQVWTVYGTNNTVSSRRILAVHPDHLNTPRAMSDANKKMVWRWDGDAYGSQKPNENPDGDGTVDTLNLRFPGQFYDAETGYYYNVNRDYDPGTGRYLESDPIGLTGGLNTYGYALQNPISYIDPLGLSSTMTWPARLGIAGTAAASDGPLPIGDLVAAGLIVEGIYEVCKDKTCPPCKTVSGRVVPVGTVAYRPLDIIPDDVKQHGVYGSHHNIFIAKQYPAPKCDCFWQKQSYVLKPDQLPAGAIPIEPFAN
jgi:RHS repeat-associated protein